MTLPPTRTVDWEQRYRDGTARWERGALHPAFLAWCESGVLAPCRILVPGAGRSPEPLALAEAGFEVTVVDLAPSAVEAQRAALEGQDAHVEQADLLTWAPEFPYDAVYDQTCLCALPPALLPDYAARLAAWVRPGGRLFALLMQTGRPGGPPFDCPPDQVRSLLAEAEWDWPADLPPAFPHPSGGAEIPVVLHQRRALA